ncbi:WecB/TagA/CpsF family glycosyltransferase [Merismopedia glauca]|uniref:Glycosyltransferase n=1 Tax=Merismopedia glauca CCAP 1448/3 TaxID=1296344 RepID=A0A2T1C8E0_9CYAN|nr:WecB/TagA/CpsF family glycosyltransferase [Merismopedia glauca]PSB04514.1 glycosyltransferase [Merismopedia glauca CCAP 1448/3]
MTFPSESLSSTLIPEFPEKFAVLGIGLHLLDDYSSWLSSRLSRKIPTHVVTLNAEMVMQALENSDLAQIIEQAELVIPDGAGITFYLSLYGKECKRCPGIEIAEFMVTEAANLGTSAPVFFYGGKPGVTQQAAAMWQKQLPEIAIAGTEHGYITPAEETAFLQKLSDLQPSLILVGLGVPRQEFWIAKHRHICPQAIWIGVGGSFDIWAGVKTRAPGWLRDRNLEWLYRLYQEPWRWRRMLALPHFALKALGNRVGLKMKSEVRSQESEV